MNSSGIKRGLAASAVAALAVTGLPFLAGAAHAAPITTGAITLQSITDGGYASSKNDGTNSTISLVATAQDTARQVKFSYTAGGKTTDIATVSRGADGTFSTEWAPPAPILGTNVTLTATVVDADPGAPILGTSTAASTTVTADKGSADLTPSATAIGLYQNPGGTLKGSFKGTASGDVTSVALGSTLPVVGSGTATAGGGAFAGVLTVPSYPFLQNGANELLVTASVGGSIADAQKYDVYKATIAGLTATPARPVVQPSAPNNTSKITVLVKDQKNNPIVGAKVYEIVNGAPVAVGSETDAKGEVETGVKTAGTYTFFADVNGNGSYDEGIDYKTTATITASAVETSAVPGSKLGPAFDIDESGNASADGNFSVTVKDQNAQPLAGKRVFYSWAYTPFKPGKPIAEGGNGNVARTITTEANGTAGLTDANGVAELVFPTINGGDTQGGTFVLTGYVNLDGTPGQGAGDLALTSATYKVGESSIVWADGSLAQRQAGGLQTFTGTLQLPDGTVLGGKALTVNYARGGAWDDNDNWLGAGGLDAAFAQQADQPAGVTRQSDFAVTTRTAANGTFSVVVKDPVEADQVAKETGTLTATGVAVDTGVNPAKPGVGLDSTGSVAVEFLKHPEAKNVDVSVAWGSAQPGEAVPVYVHVTNPNGKPLSTNVALSVDHGAIDKGIDANADGVAEAPEEVVTNGGLQGVYKNDGAATTVHSNANGDAMVYLTIEKDAGFDDDGYVTAKVTGKVGAVSGSDKLQWSTHNNPLNLGSVELKLSSDQSQDANTNPPGYTSGSDGVSGLPAAAANRLVWVDLVATDQFGNRVGTAFDLSDNTGKADFWGSNTSQYTDDSPAIALYDHTGQTVDQVLTATYDGVGATYGDTNPNQDGVQLGALNPALTKTDDVAVNWYAIDYSASTFSLSHSGASKQAVNSTVTVTYKAVDQKGKPIVGLPVTFFRGGPDTNGNGEGIQTQFRDTTDQNGVATYVFKGVAAGTASVTAVPADQNSNPIAAGQKDTTIVFSGSASHGGAAHAIRASIIATSGHRDVVTVTAPAPDGTVVTLYKKVRGHAVKVGQVKLSGGKATFRVKDLNGKKVTKYYGVVSASSTTKSATTAVKRVK